MPGGPLAAPACAIFVIAACGVGCGDNLAAPDAAVDAMVTDQCDPLLQNCADGQACFWAGSTEYRCAIPGGLPLYHPCSAVSQCSLGAGCHLDDRTEIYCTRYCDYLTYAGERDPRCGEHELCASWDGMIGICMGICDARAQPCPDDQGCYTISDAADLCFPVVTPGAVGDACIRLNDCDTGNQCDEGTCRRLCDFEQFPGGADPVCAGAVCTGPFGTPTVGRCL